jgi:DNA-binding GntR family transcriptional regulator
MALIAPGPGEVIAQHGRPQQAPPRTASPLTEAARPTLNREFHFAIFGLSPLTIMVEELERLWRLAHLYILTDMMTPDSRRTRVAEHSALIQRLEEQDLPGVIEALGRHRNRSRLPTRTTTTTTPGSRMTPATHA